MDVIDRYAGFVIECVLTLGLAVWDILFIAQYIRTRRERTRENLVKLAGYFFRRRNTKERRQKEPERMILFLARFHLVLFQVLLALFIWASIRVLVLSMEG